MNTMLVEQIAVNLAASLGLLALAGASAALFLRRRGRLALIPIRSRGRNRTVRHR